MSEVGTNHIYSCDTFNENTPSKNSTEFLRAMAKATYEAMTFADPKAVWYQYYSEMNAMNSRIHSTGNFVYYS